jgi:hypothetical protein
LKIQRNILAKYRDDEEKVISDLMNKRKEFEKRISVCKERYSRTVAKDLEVNCSNNPFINRLYPVLKYFFSFKHKKLGEQYKQFIEEKKRIRERAVEKYQTELMIRLQKTLEFDILKNELDKTKLK